MSKHRSITESRSEDLEESKLARESSNFDQYLAKEKLQQGLNKSPLVSRELPRVKGVHNVETPKYNREQILKNIEKVGLRGRVRSLITTFAKSTHNKGNTLQKGFHGEMANMRTSLRILIRQQENQHQSDIVLI